MREVAAAQNALGIHALMGATSRTRPSPAAGPVQELGSTAQRLLHYQAHPFGLGATRLGCLRSCVHGRAVSGFGNSRLRMSFEVDDGHPAHVFIHAHK